MDRRTFIAVSASGVALLATGEEVFACEKDKVEGYLSDNGTLKEHLVFTHKQSGVAGVTGRIETVNKTGAFETVYFNPIEKAPDPEKKGELSKEALKEIAGVLAAQKFSTLPKRFGRNPSVVNTRTLVLEFGKEMRELILNPGKGMAIPEEVPSYIEEKEECKRFLNIVRSIREKIDAALKGK